MHILFITRHNLRLELAWSPCPETNNLNCSLATPKRFHYSTPHPPSDSFLGPRGPLRTPLVPVRPQQKFTQPLIISFPFLSNSKLKQPLPQYTVHRTLNRINSRTFLAQLGFVDIFTRIYLPYLRHFATLTEATLSWRQEQCSDAGALLNFLLHHSRLEAGDSSHHLGAVCAVCLISTWLLLAGLIYTFSLKN